MYTKDMVQMIKDRLHTISQVTRACHLYAVAAGTLPAAQETTYKKKTPHSFFCNSCSFKSKQIKLIKKN